MSRAKHIILYIDDDEDDRLLVQEAIEKDHPRLQLQLAGSGFEGLQYLNGAFHSGKLPSLIILDLNMPGMSGKETLLAIREDEAYDPIPVVMFTTSSSPADKAFCEKHGVELVTKPLSFVRLGHTIEKLVSYCRI